LQRQIEEISRTRQITLDIRITSPATGFITARKVSPGERFLKGDELYRIADLSRVWILADVFEHEVQYFKPGARATVSIPYQKKTYRAVASEVLPVFDPVTRTLKVRLETDNPGFVLRPDMFADVELAVELPPAVTVPADAVLYSGKSETVFVDRGRGFFEPRRVATGWRMGDRVEIVRGLMPGERIVLAGNFFIDSESRLQAAALGIYGAVSLDPVCGMEVDEARAKVAGMTSDHAGRTYYFCAAVCKQEFDRAPEQFLEDAAGKHEPAGHGAHSGAGHD
jgi:RND family efflux transporter MFP subunit